MVRSSAIVRDQFWKQVPEQVLDLFFPVPEEVSEQVRRFRSRGFQLEVNVKTSLKKSLRVKGRTGKRNDDAVKSC